MIPMTGLSTHNTIALSFRGLTILSGLAASVYFVSDSSFSPIAWLPVIFLACLAFVAELYPLELPGYGVVSGLESVVVASLYLGEPAGAMMVLGAGVLSRSVRRGEDFHWDFAFYSFSQQLLSYGIPFAVLHAVGGSGTLACAGAMIVAVALDQVFAALHLYFLQDRLGRFHSRVEWDRVRLSLSALIPVGVLLGACTELGLVATVLLLLPLAIAFNGIRTYVDTLREAREVVASMVEAVERREQGTEGHAERVAVWAGSIARELGLRERAVRQIVAAARMHDLGKIGIEESILNKDGVLSAEEIARLRRHPEVGAKVAAHLSLGKTEAQYIYHHHENFDGTGYPAGLAGAEIPQGARILAVAEAFDSMISSPRRSGQLTPRAALAELESSQGSQFDPSVVAAFRTVLRKRIA